ncbi:MAG: hypothetical protein M1820_000535 [Bogoriella megaspora]|nr:MAG: hypothetical protein M1820_000535 [Bogoriella megaspora]
MVAQALGGNGPLMIGISYAGAIIGAVMIGLRYYAGKVTGRLWPADMIWVTISFTFAMIAQVLLVFAACYGIGNHQSAVDPKTAQTGFLYQWIFHVFSILSMGFGKLAIVALLLNIQGPTHPKKRIFLLFVGSSTMFLDAFQATFVWFQCEPKRKLWLSDLPGNCDLQTQILASGVFQGTWSATSDFILAIYPIFVFWGLNASLKMRLGLAGLFLGGLVAGVAAIMKSVSILTLLAKSDVLYAVSPLMLWAVTENWLIIIMGSIPPIRALFVRFFRRMGLTPSSKNSYGDSVHLSNMRPSQRDRLGSRRSTGLGSDFIIMSKSADGIEEVPRKDGGIRITTNVTVDHDEKSFV